MQHPPLSNRREWALLLTLAGIQFTHILDFMIMMPLGPQLIADFSISDAQFGLLVSAYTFAAGLSGLVATTYIDRFERKRLMSILYGLFTLSTLGCALAPTFSALMLARVAAGLFGGVMSAMTQTVVGDVIPFERRGRAMGVVMTAFSVASVAGVPVGLLIAAHTSWHAPFFAVGIMSVFLLILAQWALPTMGHHLLEDRNKSTLGLMKEVIWDRNHLYGFVMSFAMILAGFSVIPFITLYMETNAHLSAEQIPIVYLLGGATTLLTANLLGRFTDRYGKVRVFRWVSLFSMVPMMAITLSAGLPLWLIFSITTLFFIFVSGRRIPAMALLTSIANPNLRGSFITLNTALQSAAMGVGALIGGILIGRSSEGLMTGYWMCGALAIAGNLIAIWVTGKMAIRD